jgi:hypothetical protein
MSRRLLCLALLIVASQVWPLSRLVPMLPAAGDPSRSPSSDVLMGALPFAHAAGHLDTIAGTLPPGPGVVVGHGSSDQLASAYFVVAMRLWPRRVSYVACEPAPRVEQFRAPHAPPRFEWRIDLWPGRPDPVRIGDATPAQDAGALCTAVDAAAPPRRSGQAIRPDRQAASDGPTP